MVVSRAGMKVFQWVGLKAGQLVILLAWMTAEPMDVHLVAMLVETMAASWAAKSGAVRAAKSAALLGSWMVVLLVGGKVNEMAYLLAVGMVFELVGELDGV